MTRREALRTPIFALTCAFALFTAVSPAAAEDCPPCFGSTPDYCGGTGDDTYYASSGEVVAGFDGDDYLYGSSGSGEEKICGNLDVDHVFGGAGNDQVDGSEQQDVVHGDSGNDWVGGGSGDDLLYGHYGSPYDFDTLSGGSGFDRCYFGDVRSSCEWSYGS